MAPGREAKAERRLGQRPVCVGPCSSAAAPTRQAVAGRMPSTLPWQHDFPQHQRASGFHSCLPRSLRPGVCSEGHRGPLPPGWEKGRREKLPLRPGRELAPE